MAATPVLFSAPQGLTLTLSLYAGTTAAASESATEYTNDRGCYGCTFTDVSTGVYNAVAMTTGSIAISRGYLRHGNTTSCEYVGEYGSEFATDSITAAVLAGTVASGVWSATTRSITGPTITVDSGT